VIGTASSPAAIGRRSGPTCITSVWWETGGRTDYDNLLLLCGRHHHLVHEGGWRLAGSAMDFSIYRPDGELWAHVIRGPP
jgi:hypothetical protein